MTTSRLSALVTLPVAALVLTACGTSDSESDAGGGGADGMDVVVGFYPLEFATSRIAGDLASVETLTSPGVDPHDVELSPQSVASVQQADLVVYSSGLQAAVDDAAQQQAPDHSFDVNEVANLIDTGTEDVHDHGAESEGEHADEEGHSQEEHADEEGHSEDEHADEEGHSEDEHADEEEGHSEDEHADEEGHSEEEEGHDHGAQDPHFWLDPERMANVSEAIAAELSAADPDNAETYEANAAELVEELDALKDDYDSGLASCEQVDMVTTHEAFGYIAVPYGFHQVGVSGLAPDSEPTAARLAEVSELVQEQDVTTIYSEVLLGEDIAETVAGETGAEVMLLDPIEGITDASPGSDYLEVMQANLDTLREGQGCS